MEDNTIEKLFAMAAILSLVICSLWIGVSEESICSMAIGAIAGLAGGQILKKADV
jgi:hypothetical protein